jgi:hypothetical protein
MTRIERLLPGADITVHVLTTRTIGERGHHVAAPSGTSWVICGPAPPPSAGLLFRRSPASTRFAQATAGLILNLRTLRPILAGMPRKPEPPPLSSFDVFKLASKAVWLATVEATDELDAIKKVSKKRRIRAYRLIATRRQ